MTMTTRRQAEQVRYRDVEGLIQNLNDPEKVVRIASMRAGIRIATMEEFVSPGLRAEILGIVEQGLSDYRTQDIFGASLLPTAKVQQEMARILSPFDKVDAESARLVIDKTAKTTKWVVALRSLTTLQRLGDADKLALKAIKAPDDADVASHFEGIHVVQPELGAHLVTSLFARLAIRSCHPRLEDLRTEGEDLLAEAEHIGSVVQSLGPRFQPDVGALAQVYQSFFRGNSEFWLEWLQMMKNQGEDVQGSMPSWFPLYEGTMAATREIEWTVSRSGMRATLEGLKKSLGSNVARDRWAAAQLIENAARYTKETDHPVFGGGSGPDDLDLSAEKLGVEYRTAAAAPIAAFRRIAHRG